MDSVEERVEERIKKLVKSGSKSPLRDIVGRSVVSITKTSSDVFHLREMCDCYYAVELNREQFLRFIAELTELAE